MEFCKSTLSEEQLMSRSCRDSELRTNQADKVSNPEGQSQAITEKGDGNDVHWVPECLKLAVEHLDAYK